MKLYSKILLALLIAAPLQFIKAQDKVGTTAAPFLSIGTFTRGTAMGGAFTAISDDENSLFWNPGGLAQVKKNIVSFSNTTYFVGTSYQDVSAAFYTGLQGTFGLRLMVLNYGDEGVTTIQAPEGTGERYSAMDLSINLTYSRYLTNQFSFGATAKYISQRIWNTSSNGFAVDLGVLYTSPFKNLRIGMSITNFGTDMQMFGDDLKQAHDIDPNINGNNDLLPAYMETSLWALPLNFRVGLAMDVFENSLNRLTVAVDAKHPSDNAEALDVGLEYAFKNMLFLRGGYRNLFIAEQMDGGVTAGFGLNYDLNSRNSIKIGYSFQYHKYLSHPQMWSLGISF